MIDFVKVGSRIAKYRRERGMSQDELAGLLYVTRQAVSKWENGTSVPSIDALCEISRMFSVSFEEILGLFEDESFEVDSEDIFKGRDRSFVINKIARGEIKVNLADVFYQMSPAERMYILREVKDGNIAVDREELYAKLTPSEQRFLGGKLYEIR